MIGKGATWHQREEMTRQQRYFVERWESNTMAQNTPQPDVPPAPAPIATLRNLSPREEAFVREYVLDPSPTNAAIRAGYAKPSARQQGNALLRRPHIRIAIAKAQALAAERVAVDAAWVVARLATEAMGKGPDTTSAARVRAAELLGKHLGLWDGLAGKPASPSTVVNVLTLTAGDVEMARQLISGHAPGNVVTLTTLPGEPSHAPDNVVKVTTLSGEPSHALPGPSQAIPEPVALPTLADCARGEGGEGVGPAHNFSKLGEPSSVNPSRIFSKSGEPPLADPPIEESRPVDPEGVCVTDALMRALVHAYVVEQLDGPRLFEPENA